MDLRKTAVRKSTWQHGQPRRLRINGIQTEPAKKRRCSGISSARASKLTAPDTSHLFVTFMPGRSSRSCASPLFSLLADPAVSSREDLLAITLSYHHDGKGTTHSLETTWSSERPVIELMLLVQLAVSIPCIELVLAMLFTPSLKATRTPCPFCEKCPKQPCLKK